MSRSTLGLYTKIRQPLIWLAFGTSASVGVFGSLAAIYCLIKGI